MKLSKTAALSVSLFLIGVGIIVLTGFFEGLRPIIGTDVDGDPRPRLVTIIIEVVMGVIAALIFLTCKVKAADVPKQSTRPAGSVPSPSSALLFALALAAVGRAGIQPGYTPLRLVRVESEGD